MCEVIKPGALLENLQTSCLGLFGSYSILEGMFNTPTPPKKRKKERKITE